MQSQLGMLLPFYHKGCGGQIKQAAHPTVVSAQGMGPALKYFCTGCQKYVEPADVTEDVEAAKKMATAVKTPVAPAVTPAVKPAAVPAPAAAPSKPAPVVPPAGVTSQQPEPKKGT